MAPEQMEASTVVTGAIDIYAFGLVLFEMVTGRRAFPTTNLLTGITQRLSGPPPSARFINPDIPEKWEITIQTCLRRNPSERFSSAGAVIEALEGARSSPLHSVPIRIPASSAEISVHSRPWQHKWAIAITGLVVIVSLFAVWLRLYRQKGESKVAPGALVYLTQIQNQTGIHAFDNLTELLKASLGQSTRINLLDQGRVGDTLQLMTKPPDSTIDAPTAREIAMRTGAVRIIFATLTGSAGSYKLDVDIQQPDNTPAHARNDWKESFVWKAASGQPGNAIPQEILHTIRDAADWIRAKAGESANDIARLDTPPEDVTTSNWEALQEYARAEAFVSARQQEKAVDVLENAVRIDPQFALAYGRLGDVLDSISRDADGYQAYSKALSVGFQARLTRRERDRIKGMMALDTEDEAAAEAAFRDYATYYEYDYAGWFYRAYPLMMLGRTGEAIETLKKAFSLDPDRVSAPAHLARYALLEHNTEDAWRWQAWLQSHGFSEDASFVAGQIELTTAHYAAAEQSFTALLKSKDPYYQSLADSLLARFYAERGELPQAQSSLEAGMAIDNLHNFVALQQEKLIDQAYLQCADGKWAEAASDIRSALKLNPGLRDLISASATLGWCNTRSNAAHSDTLVDILRAVQRRLPAQEDSLLSQDAAFRIAGELALAQGDWKLGVEEMEKANTVEPPSNSRAYLARAYETAAHLNADTAGLHHYLEMALAVDQTLASQDALAWNRMLVFPPGSYSETLESLLRVSRELKRPLSDPIREAQARLNALRLPASRQAGNRFLQHAVPPFTSTPFSGE
jgi:tetratricopeptide (TPR) repeat protein